MTDRLLVELDAAARAPIALERDAAGVHLRLAARGGERRAAERWLSRAAPVGERLRAANVAASAQTLVLACDPRAEPLARAFAEVAGAPLARVEPDAVAAAVEGAHGVRSVTTFLLADALDERLLDAIWTANRARSRRGTAPLPFGLMAAPTPARLAWLVAKTLVWLARPRPPARFVLADFDGFEGRGTLRTLAGGRCVSTAAAIPADTWRSPATDVAAVFTHSVSFDASLGELALCGRQEGLPAGPRLAAAPRCAHDGRCFRVDGSPGAPTGLLRAVDAGPLVWFLNGCGTVPLAGSAFGLESAYAYGLLAGAAIAVVGPHVTQVSERWRNAVLGGLLATGATTGEAAGALAGLVAGGGFHSYPLLGSPDVRIAAPQRAAPAPAAGGRARYAIAGRSLVAARLELPPAFRSPPVALADDGGHAWRNAALEPIAVGGRTEALVVLDPPRDLDGWLELGPDEARDTELAAEAVAIDRRLRVLRLYGFARPEHGRIDACEAVLGELRRVLAARRALRRRIAAAALRVRLELALDELHAAVCRRFVEHVRAHDFNMDRESYNGFAPGVVRRTRRTCPACGSALFVAADRSLEDPGCVREKTLCANCFGVSMALADDPLRVAPLRLRRLEEGPQATLSVRLRNPGPHAVRAWVAGAARRGGAAAVLAPLALDVPARRTLSRSLRFDLAGEPSGTQSLRVVVAAAGAARFHNFKIALSRARAAPAARAGRAG